MTWKIKSSKEVYRNKWMRVTEDQLVTDSGDKLTWGVVRKEPFVVIIPWDGKHFTLVGQYRYPVNFFSWEFPEGHTDGIKPEKAAIMELAEETGQIAGNIKQVSDYHLAPGYQTQVGYVFLATDLKLGKIVHEGAEKDMKIRKVSVEKFEDMVRSGEIKDGLTLAAYTLLRLSKEW